jgi:hypothetical protein
MTHPVNQLDNLAIVQLEMHLWTGKVKLDDPDIKLGVGGKIPPKELAELGRKYVIDRAHLRPFGRLKTSARRLCLNHGMPFMNGFAVPMSAIDAIQRGLDDIAAETHRLKVNFVHQYDDFVGEWVNKNPDYAHAIRAGALPKAVVEKRISFDYQVFKIDPVNHSEAQKLNIKASGLSEELIDEIVVEANDFFHNNMKGSESCKGSTRKTLQRLRDKVDGLSFLDSRFSSIVQLLTTTIQRYPAGGKSAEGEQYFRILSAVLILSSRSKIHEYATGSVDVDTLASTMQAGLDVITSVPQHTHDAGQDESDDNAKSLDLTLPDDDELDQLFGSGRVANSGSSYF